MWLLIHDLVKLKVASANSMVDSQAQRTTSLYGCSLQSLDWNVGLEWWNHKFSKKWGQKVTLGVSQALAIAFQVELSW